MYPSRQPLAVNTSPRRSFFAAQSAWYQKSDGELGEVGLARP